jgi:xanthine dehydrogenase accessory factor
MILEARGSTPRGPGTAMLVTEDGLHGTIGGGRVEFECVAEARRLLTPSASRGEAEAGGVPAHPPAAAREGRPPERGGAAADLGGADPLSSPAARVGRSPMSGGAAPAPGWRPQSATAADLAGLPRTIDFPLGPDLDQCCGGYLRAAFALLSADDAPRFEAGEAALWPGGPVWRDGPPPRPALVYGAGHVGRALVAALAPLPFALSWIDPRPGLMDAAPEGVATVETPLPEAEAARAPAEAFHIVLTHSHALDLEIVAAALAARPGFVGLIGSATKRATFARKLRARGLDPAGMTCPIGLPDLADKRPPVIAASVAADLLRRDAALRAASEAA